MQGQGSLQENLARFLIAYRSSPHTVTGDTPTELFLGRELRTRLSLIKTTVKKQYAQSERASECRPREENTILNRDRMYQSVTAKEPTNGSRALS